PDGSIERGTTFELGKTYCAITVRSEDVIGIEQMATSPYKGHPAYEAFGLEAYLGVPLTVNGQPYGTLNFSAPHPQAAPFSEADRDFVRLMARWVSATIEQLLAEQRLREQAVRLADANKELAIARRRAEESNRLKSEFLATKSHELRTPLNAIIGFADIQLSGMAGELTGKQQHFTDRIMANGEHLLTLINNILDLSKIEAGRVEIVHDPFVPADLLEAIAGPMQGLADSKGLALKTVCDPNLPATLTGDPGRIKQVAINLLSNAIKFTDAGSVTMAFRRLDPHTWAIEVSDTGVGIPSHAQEMIFESFRQADSSTTRQHRGTGLGLAIVRNLAMLMGGQARVRSTPGEGSTFTVTLPLSVPTVQEEPHVH
ncbi:MAG: GAF domain-containing protein, partial [Chloroflexi bacterium]|nr:GAF domain-containing protein [Chloroflexota bacterium]